MSPNEDFIKSTRTAFRIIEIIQQADGAGVTHISDKLELSKSAVHKHLQSLLVEEYVTKKNSEYHLSLKFLDHGGFALSRSDLAIIARPKIRELAEELGELTNFALKSQYRGAFVFNFNDQYNLRRKAYIGKRFYLHQTAAGKAMLSKLSDDEITAVIEAEGLPANTEESITTEQELMEEISMVRERGYAKNVGEYRDEIKAIGAPVVDPETGDIGAISLSSPYNARKSDFREYYIKKIQETAQKIELIYTNR